MKLLRKLFTQQMANGASPFPPINHLNYTKLICHKCLRNCGNFLKKLLARLMESANKEHNVGAPIAGAKL